MFSPSKKGDQAESYKTEVGRPDVKEDLFGFDDAKVKGKNSSNGQENSTSDLKSDIAILSSHKSGITPKSESIDSKDVNIETKTEFPEKTELDSQLYSRKSRDPENDLPNLPATLQPYQDSDYHSYGHADDPHQPHALLEDDVSHLTGHLTGNDFTIHDYFVNYSNVITCILPYNNTIIGELNFARPTTCFVKMKRSALYLTNKLDLYIFQRVWRLT